MACAALGASISGAAVLESLHFDGEFADRLLDGERAEADRAVNALCQLYLLDEVSEFAREYWEKSAKAQTARTASGLARHEQMRDQLVAREKKIKAAQADANSKVGGLEKEILGLNERLRRISAASKRLESAMKVLGWSRWQRKVMSRRPAQT